MEDAATVLGPVNHATIIAARASAKKGHDLLKEVSLGAGYGLPNLEDKIEEAKEHLRRAIRELGPE